MEKALLDWADIPDGNPNGRPVCHLIEPVVAEK